MIGQAEIEDIEEIKRAASRYLWLRDQPQSMWEQIGFVMHSQNRAAERDRLIDEAQTETGGSGPLDGATQYD